MTKEELVREVKQIIGLVRAGKLDEAHASYASLFSRPDFLVQRPEDQRQALKLLIHAKAAKTEAFVQAHRAAVLPLTELVSTYDDPADYEMLGMVWLLLGNDESASRMFRAGLAIERTRNPQSDLCGALMRRVSEI